jgi:hypothetical protein
MAPHPSHSPQPLPAAVRPDEVMFMAATEPPRYWNRIRTAPVCEQCLSARSPSESLGSGVMDAIG